jgi:hypothetical protein
MATSINFVSKRRATLTKLQVQDRKFMKTVTGVLVAVFAIFLLILGARFYFVFTLGNLQNQQEDVRNVIISHEEVEKEYVLFTQKLRQLTVLFGSRKDKQEAFEFFSTVFGNDVIVSGIDFSSANEDLVSFTIQTPNVFVMERVFNILESPQITDVYPRVTRRNLRRTATGNYSVDLAIVLVADVSQAGSTDQSGVGGSGENMDFLDDEELF